MADSDAANAWRTGTPEPGVVVEVWAWLRVTAAVWTGGGVDWRGMAHGWAGRRGAALYQPLAPGGRGRW